MSVNYSSILSIQAPTNTRTQVSLFPVSGSTFNCDGSSTVQFNIPATSYMDPAASFIRFRARIHGTTVATGIGVSTSISLDGGCTSLVQKSSLYTGDSSVNINEIANFAEVAQHMLKAGGQTYVETVGTQSLGFHPAMNTDTGRNDHDIGDYSSVHGACLHTVNCSPKNAYGIPGAVVIPASTGAGVNFNNLGNVGPYGTLGTTAAGGLLATSLNTAPLASPDGTESCAPEYVSYAIPLSFFAGMFDQPNLIPLKLFGRSNALRLDLVLNDPRRYLRASSWGPNGPARAAVWDASTDLGITIDNVEMICTILNVSPEMDANITEIMMKEGLAFQVKNYTTRFDAGWAANTQQFTNTVAKYAISMNMLSYQFRDSSRVNLLSYPSITGYKRFGVGGGGGSIQFSVGPRLSTQKAQMLLGKNFNGDSYLQALQCSKKGNSLLSNNGYWSQGYLNNDLTGWTIGYNLSSRSQSNAVHDDCKTYNGYDTRAGSATINSLLYRDLNDKEISAGLTITMIFQCSSPVRCTADGVTPSKD